MRIQETRARPVRTTLLSLARTAAKVTRRPVTVSQPLTGDGGGGSDGAGEGSNDAIVTFRVGGPLPVWPDHQVGRQLQQQTAGGLLVRFDPLCAGKAPEASWLAGVLTRRPAKVAAVAMANKTARISPASSLPSACSATRYYARGQSKLKRPT